jgi:uncharacterized membrane protein YhaH (DUF805 family)
MKKTQDIVKSILSTFFAIIFVFSISGIKSKAMALSDSETLNNLQQQITDVKLQVTQKQVELLKQQIVNVQTQIIQLLQQRIAALQTQIAEKQKQIAVATPSTSDQKTAILQQQIADIQAQIAEKQEQLAALIPSTPAPSTPAAIPSSAPISILPSAPEETSGLENVIENAEPELSAKSAQASITSFFSTDNFSQLFFFIVIVIIALAALALFRSKNREKNWIPYFIILIAPFIYRVFYSNNWLILLALSIGLLIIDWMMQSSKERQAKIEFLK